MDPASHPTEPSTRVRCRSLAAAACLPGQARHGRPRDGAGEDATMPRRRPNGMCAECLVRGGQVLRADHRELRGTPPDTPCDGPANFWAPSSKSPWYTITRTHPATQPTTWILWKKCNCTGLHTSCSMSSANHTPCLVFWPPRVAAPPSTVDCPKEPPTRDADDAFSCPVCLAHASRTRPARPDAFHSKTGMHLSRDGGGSCPTRNLLCGTDAQVATSAAWPVAQVPGTGGPHP